MVITIDGTVGSGKSTAAARLARALGAVHLDTGAMYRAVTLKALDTGADLTNEAVLAQLAAEADIELEPGPEGTRVRLDGRDVTDAIRANRVSTNAYHVAQAAGVRAVLVETQRAFAEGAGDLVAEGRDQGTVVFPDAAVKFFLDADPAVRARRRQRELEAKGEFPSFRQVLEEVRQRDARDTGRAVAPLAAAPDAVHVDTTDLDVDAMVETLRTEVRRRTG